MKPGEEMSIPRGDYKCGDVFKCGERFWKIYAVSYDGTIWAATIDMNPFIRNKFRVEELK